MSSLLVANDLDIMMLEFAVQKLFLPRETVFDSVIMKKTTVMFRMLDSEWTAVNPQRTDYTPYYGSNLEEMNFHGGKSVVFAIPTGSLKKIMKGVDIQIHVIKQVSKYFQVNPSLERQNVGVAFANVDHLFNGIIKDLREREELKEYLNCFHKRQPISRSLKESYEIVDENEQKTGATIEIYVRLSYFGKCVITEIEKEHGLRAMFYAQEETNENSRYQCQELDRSEVESGCWGNESFSPPVRADRLVCHCDKWGITDHKPDGKKVDGDTLRDKGSAKGGLSSESRENVGKGGKKASHDDDDDSIRQVKKGGKKTGRTSRSSKSADELRRKPKGNGSDEELSGQKDKRAKGHSEDRKTMRKLDKTGEKSWIETEGHAGDATASKDYAKLLLAQLRRRCRGNVTVGIVDKKTSVCQSAAAAVAIPSPQRQSTCPVALMSPQLCSNLSYSSACCYPRAYPCSNPPLASLTYRYFHAQA